MTPSDPHDHAASTHRVALVTGAAQHVGFAIAAALVADGMQVFVNDREAGPTREAAERLGPNAIAAPADLSREDQLRQMFERVIEQSGRMDVLVHNACVHGVGYGFLETPIDVLDNVLAVNLRAAFLLGQLAGQRMASRGSGVIIHVGSNTSSRAIRNRSAYIASKGGLDALTRAMAVDLGPLGIRVNTVAPGYVRTARWDTLPKEQITRRRRNVPLGRETTPEDVARAVRFLCDPDLLITGQRLVLDGGVEVQAFPSDADQ